MKIIIFCESSSTGGKGLTPFDHSYYHILDKYLPALHALGDVLIVKNPDTEVDDIFNKALLAGEKSVFLSFTPPDRTTRILGCPTICVLPWEFDTIPNEKRGPDELKENWVEAIEDIGNVITASDYAAGVIRRQVNAQIKISSIPAPVACACSRGERLRSVFGLQGTRWRNPGRAKRPLEVSALVIDSDTLEINADGATPKDVDAGFPGARQSLWDGQTLEWRIGSGSVTVGQYLVGFYGEEDRGCWSRTSHPSIVLPWRVAGEFELILELAAYGENSGRMLDVRIGDEVAQLRMASSKQSYKLSFSLPLDGASSIQFDGVTAATAHDNKDHRTLGINLSRLLLRREENTRVSLPSESSAANDNHVPARESTLLRFSGTVYSSVFDSTDERKNLDDMVRAFCWAFRNDSTRTLVLKMSDHNNSSFMGALWPLFSRLSPFECRIVVIHGFLSEGELDDLIKRTDYVVCVSQAEKQCLSVLEFMARGVPAIAPDHTAMEGLIKPENAFVVDSSLQPQFRPGDGGHALCTQSHRINWDSLWQAFIESAKTVDTDKRRYRAMSHEARQVVYDNYSVERVAGLLESALKCAAD